MSFFSFLFRRLAPTIVDDEFFGRLVLEPRGQYHSAYCYYAERIVFRPTGAAIECMIDTSGTTGPTLVQRAFFQHIEEAYSTILPAIINIVENDSGLLATGHSFVNFASTHRLAGITIPELNKAPVNWDIWFEPIDTSYWGYSILVDMVDDIPQAGVGISA